MNLRAKEKEVHHQEDILSEDMRVPQNPTAPKWVPYMGHFIDECPTAIGQELSVRQNKVLWATLGLLAAAVVARPGRREGASFTTWEGTRTLEVGWETARVTPHSVLCWGRLARSHAALLLWLRRLPCLVGGGVTGGDTTEEPVRIKYKALIAMNKVQSANRYCLLNTS